MNTERRKAVFCVDCKWCKKEQFVLRSEPKPSDFDYYCDHPDMPITISMVTAERLYKKMTCEFSRSNEGLCGESGSLWEPKPEEPKPQPQEQPRKKWLGLF